MPPTSLMSMASNTPLRCAVDYIPQASSHRRDQTKKKPPAAAACRVGAPTDLPPSALMPKNVDSKCCTAPGSQQDRRARGRNRRRFGDSQARILSPGEKLHHISMNAVVEKRGVPMASVPHAVRTVRPSLYLLYRVFLLACFLDRVCRAAVDCAIGICPHIISHTMSWPTPSSKNWPPPQDVTPVASACYARIFGWRAHRAFIEGARHARQPRRS